jgi:hypothetical protein
MKKLLVLVLVLAFASLANATYIISINLAGNLITVSNDAAMLGGIDTGLGIIGNATFDTITYRTVGAPTSDPVVVDYSAQDLIDFDLGGLGYTGGMKTVFWGDPVLTPNPAGMWYTIGVTGTPGTVIVMADSSGTPLGGSVVIPEPATIALLCIGGLLLRKKK